jgi:hypothetical protein
MWLGAETERAMTVHFRALLKIVDRMDDKWKRAVVLRGILREIPVDCSNRPRSIDVSIS